MADGKGYATWKQLENAYLKNEIGWVRGKDVLFRVSLNFSVLIN